MKGGRWVKSIVLALVAALAAAQPLASFAAAQPPVRHARAARLLPAALPLAADFDQDSTPDLAELFAQGNRKEIQLTLSSAWTTHLHFETSALDSGRLIAGDIDQDHDADLIWVSHTDPRSFAVWLGDGHGRFEAAPEPHVFDDVVMALADSREGNTLAGGRSAADTLAVLPINSVPGALNRRIDISLPVAALVTEQSDQKALFTASTYRRKRGPPPRLS
jgi:hypothetical protein